MPLYGPKDYQLAEIAGMTKFLQDCARQQRLTHYDEACEVASHWGQYQGPHDKRLWDLLGLISEHEVATGRAALSAVVVLKAGDGANRPGQGFFELERKLGRYKEDDDKTWLGEIDALFKYWPKH